MTRVTIAAVPKPFEGHIDTIQRNALGSWRRLPNVEEILLVGDEPGLADAAADFGARHIGAIARDEEGAPKLDAVFQAADSAATTDWICYVNADIVLLPDFWDAAQLAISKLGPALCVSRRWNLTLPQALSFDDGWARRLQRAARTEGELFTPYAIDVFVYPRGLFATIPPFSIGAFSWDNWLLHEVRSRGLPVADLTAAAGVIHQNHEYRHFADADEYRRSRRALRNYWLAGDSLHGLSSTADATHVLRDDEIVPTDTATVSVIISDTGSTERLTRCLAAFEHQSYPRTFTEVIVATEHGRLRPNAVLSDFPFAASVRAASLGRSAARNKGAAVAGGDLLVFLDADVLPSGTWVEQAVAAYRSHGPGCLVASTPQLRFPDGAPTSVGYFEALSLHPSQDGDGTVIGVGDGILFSRAAWRSIGPFDQHSPDGIAEYAWLNRAAALGYPALQASCVVRRALGQTWDQLTRSVRQEVRGQVALAQLQPDDPLRTRGARWSVFTKRLAAETSRALKDGDVPPQARSGVVAVAVWAWLVRLDESLPDRRLPTSVRHRARPPRNKP